MFLQLQGVQFSCEVWVVIFVYSIFPTNVRDLQSKFPVRPQDFVQVPRNYCVLGHTDETLHQNISHTKQIYLNQSLIYLDKF